MNVIATIGTKRGSHSQISVIDLRQLTIELLKLLSSMPQERNG